jgi:hypothetical protein
MNLAEKKIMNSVSNWVTKQPEYINIKITSKESLFYFVPPIKYIELIVRFENDFKQNLIDGINKEFETYAYLPDLEEYISKFEL